jgi:limonene-1,2-epoxide hydrolase
MSSENERIVNDFCRAWSTVNIDKVMEFFAEDAVYHNMMLDPARAKPRSVKRSTASCPGPRK